MKVAAVLFIALSAFYICFHYVYNPTAHQIADLSQNITQTQGWNTTGSDQAYVILNLMFDVGIPLMLLVLGIWLFMSIQRGDPRGYYR